jgi:tRNA dimethylallyltransferase
MLAISADSRQAYRHMDIGTGKPTTTERQILPHYGLDCVKPGIFYSVYQFLTIAAAGLAAARLQQRQAWVCGGAGLYIRALVEGLALSSGPRPLLRQALNHQLTLHKPRDVAAALEVSVKDPDNPVRVLRAAESACADPQRCALIYAWCGLDACAARADAADEGGQVDAAVRGELALWHCAGIAVLDPGREELNRRIERRVGQMFSQGLVDEVAELRRLGYGLTAVVQNSIGYREAAAVLDGHLGLDAAVEQTVVRTRQYAKRQRTYFRGRGWPVVAEAQLTDWAAATARP